MSESSAIYLFPDTNVFLQCRNLDQVDLSLLGNFDRYTFVITRPVQSEIDALKGKGNGRVASRARAASTRIRELLEASDGCVQLRSGPDLVMCLRHDLKRDQSVAGELDYEERDDQLVGTVLGFHKAHPELTVRLLTHDTGPMASAKAVGVPYLVVPDEWLLQPEQDENEKRESALKAELAKYKKTEPAFALAAEAPHEKRVEGEVTMFQPLTDAEVQQLIERLTTRHPIATEFGPKEAGERRTQPMTATSSLSALYGGREVFEPATERDIEKYKEEYERWRDECEERLTKLADRLNQRLEWPVVRVRVGNTGARPADDALVVLKVEGELFLVPAKDEEDEDTKEAKLLEKLTISKPPTAPQGTWKTVRYDLGRLIDLQQVRPAWHHDLLNMSAPARRDPNALYFEKGHAGIPSQHIEFSCEQWRHAQDAEVIEFGVEAPLRPGTYSGLVALAVHAANLTEPALLRLPVRLRVLEQSAYAVAEELVADYE